VSPIEVLLRIPSGAIVARVRLERVTLEGLEAVVIEIGPEWEGGVVGEVIILERLEWFGRVKGGQSVHCDPVP
jgi:hypothetical protein